MSQKILNTIILYKIYNIKDITMTDSTFCQNLLYFIDFYMLYMLLIYSIFVTYSCIYFIDCFYIQIETLRLIKKLFNLISKLF